MQFQPTLEFAKKLDEQDPLKAFRQNFHLPTSDTGKEMVYFCGNSLGLQPKTCSAYMEYELKQWSQYAVDGHFQGKYPWYSYHEQVANALAQIVGALPSEVVAMNSLTVNLHLMMVSFYRPLPQRHKIIIEKGAFPSDIYAVKSQIEHHGFDPKTSLIELQAREGEENLRSEDILQVLEEEGERVALVMLGGINFRTGQAFPLQLITKKAKEKGCKVGFDLAHAAGNLLLHLHDWQVDFAVWCTYKYLNSGPGGIAACFVHEEHTRNKKLQRFAGWWGHNKEKRFQMENDFDPMPTAEGWQLSNPPIFQLCSLRASLDIFQKTSMQSLSEKSVKLTGLLEFLLETSFGSQISLMTPKDPQQRGCQLSIKIPQQGKDFIESLKNQGFLCDFRPPNILRVSPVPLYNRFQDVWYLVDALKRCNLK